LRDDDVTFVPDGHDGRYRRGHGSDSFNHHRVAEPLKFLRISAAANDG